MLADEQIIIPSKFNNYDSITKEYQNIKLESGKEIKKKVKYNNPDDHAKVLRISSPDSIIKIKTEELKLDYKSSSFIKFSFIVPTTLVKCRPIIKIDDISKNETEEILRFDIEVIKQQI